MLFVSIHTRPRGRVTPILGEFTEALLVSIHTRPRGRVTATRSRCSRRRHVSIHTRPRGRVTVLMVKPPCRMEFQSTPARVGG